MPNIKGIIQAHNKNLLMKANIEDNSPSKKTCNCRVRSNCPLGGKCLTKNLVYLATVTPSNGDPKQTYIGLTGCTFKERHRNHTMSFRHKSKRKATELSNFIWELKERNIEYSIAWKVMTQANTYNIGTNRCGL